jgi:hypothetical protein
MIVQLTDEQIHQAIQFIDEMRSDKIEKSVIDKKFDQKNTSYAVNLMGYLGEVAVASVLNVDTDNTVRTAGDSGYDLVFNNKTIQVKTSTLPSLIFNALELFTADVAVLVQLIGDRQNPHIDSQFAILGWISKEEFNKNYYTKDYGYGIRFVIDADKLNTELMEIANG